MRIKRLLTGLTLVLGMFALSSCDSGSSTVEDVTPVKQEAPQQRVASVEQKASQPESEAERKAKEAEIQSNVADAHRANFIAEINSPVVDAYMRDLAWNSYGVPASEAQPLIDCVQRGMTQEAKKASDDIVLRAANDPAFYQSFVNDKAYEVGYRCGQQILGS